MRFLAVLLVLTFLAGCASTPPDAEVAPVASSSRSYSGGSISPFGPPDHEWPATRQDHSAQLAVDGCASYAFFIPDFAYLTYTLRVTNGSATVRAVNASLASAACGDGRAEEWRLLGMDRVEEGDHDMVATDVVGPTAIALVVACDAPLTFESGTTRVRGPCSYDLSIDLDPDASSRDLVGEWQATP